MKNKRRKQILEVTVLLAILIFAVIITPAIIFGETNSRSTTINADMLAERISDRYLVTIGYNSSEKPEYTSETLGQITLGKGTSDAMHNGIETTVNFNYLYQLKSGISEGSVYQATFQSDDGEEYTVEESSDQTIHNGIATTTINQTITGSMTYSLFITEKVTREESLVIANRDVSICYENKSGTFFFNAKAYGLWNSDMSIAVSLNATIDQNMIAPFGRYKLNAFTNSNGQTKVNMTMPDGTVVDPGCYQYADEYGNGQHLTGWFFWATEAEYWAMDVVVWLVGLVFTFFPPTLLVGLTVQIIGALALVGDAFMADIEGTGVVVFYVLALDFYGFPFYNEVGCYTNQILGDPLNNWYYIPFYRSPPFTDDAGPYYWHTGV